MKRDWQRPMLEELNINKTMFGTGKRDEDLYISDGDEGYQFHTS